MHLDEVSKKYPALSDVVQRIKEVDKIEELYPPQEEAIKTGYLDGSNLVLSIPTAGGKTLVAEFAMLNEVLKGSKAVYIVPLRALASEKFGELKEKYGKSFKIGMSTGEFDSKGTNLGEFDILVLTIEKMDSLMRHNPPWLEKIGLVVLDEVHLLNSVDRGPTLEIVITKLMRFDVQFLALSATIENSDELASWLNAKLIDSDFRPVKLSRGVYVDGEVIFKEKDDKVFEKIQNPSLFLATDIVKRKAQSLVFTNTRKGAESEAERDSIEIYKLLSTKEKKELKKLADQILGVLDRPTAQCKRLASCIMKGVAFHHAGLHAKQRHLIEKNFKLNIIKIITATPTLAAGVNLPGKRVIIRDYRRYNSYGLEPIPVLEIHQMFGRAGRPKYDTEGEAILIAKDMPEFEMLWDYYIDGTPEPITSKLGVEPILRMHILGLLSQGPLTKQELLNFFEKTFFAHQYGNLGKISKMQDNILDQLFEWGFIEEWKNQRFKCTKLGLRIAQLYIDPMTAHDFIELLSKGIPEDMVLLTILSDAAEMHPLQSVRRSEELEIYDNFCKYDLEEEQLRAFKNAYIFFEWMNEVQDDKIFDKYNMPPGTLRTKLNIADWLLYACSEISNILQHRKIIPKVIVLRKRLKYGVKKELLPLVRIPNIGRVRARSLFRNKIKNIADVKRADPKKIEKLIGKKIAEKVLERLE